MNVTEPGEVRVRRSAANLSSEVDVGGELEKRSGGIFWGRMSVNHVRVAGMLTGSMLPQCQ